MLEEIKIGRRYIGTNRQVFIIAEISANHKQNFQNAVALIKKAKECRVDAVKFQCYTPDTLTIDVKNKYFQLRHPKWKGQSLYQLYKKAYTPWSWLKKLKNISDDLGLVFFATAFDKTSVDCLEELGVLIHKIASFELVDLPLIEYASKTKKPLILSTGMATVVEIKQAVSAARKAGAKDICLLKCISSYPANPGSMNLRTIPHMKKIFKLPVGISDHTLENAVSLTAVVLGASIVEKHLTLSRRDKTVDSFFSTEPHEFKELVRQVRIIEKALGNVHYGLTEDEINSRIYRRSLFVTQEIKKGDVFDEKNIRSIRPGYGLSPKYLNSIIGKTAKKDIKNGTPLRWALVSSSLAAKR